MNDGEGGKAGIKGVRKGGRRRGQEGRKKEKKRREGKGEGWKCIHRDTNRTNIIPGDLAVYNGGIC